MPGEESRSFTELNEVPPGATPGRDEDARASVAAGPELAAPQVAAPEVVGPQVAGADVAGPQVVGAEVPGPELQGPELARAALEAALARRTVPPRRKAGTGGSGPGGSGTGRGEPRRLRGYSGPGPDPRDPQPLGAVIDRLVKARGWQRPAAEARVFGEWEKVAGADVAAHSRPVKLENGELTIEAESTAWATQLRLLAGRLMGRIAAEVGSGVVGKLHIHGPAAPSWQRGPRRVRGRGPRDTYG